MVDKPVIINQEQHPDIYDWLCSNVSYYKSNLNNIRSKFILKDGKINVNEEVVLMGGNIKYPFGEILYGFYCSHEMITLKGCPYKVDGEFYCSNCKKLKSLIDSPKEVGGSFSCFDCVEITSLIGAPEKVKDSFDCRRCKKLTSLIGLPKYVERRILLPFSKFSNDPLFKEQYKLYLAMWLELLESVNNEERKEYITNYKDKKDYSNKKLIMPIEILKEYGF